MGVPGEGVSLIWRNSIDAVSSFLYEQHGENFKIFNVSEDAYNYEKFGNKVVWYGWPDHHSPPLDRLWKCVCAIEDWIAENPEKNVAVVHCKAGRGRTGTVVASYLLKSGRVSTYEEAVKEFASKRSKSGKGIANPSQIRYVSYIPALMFSEGNLEIKTKILKKNRFDKNYSKKIFMTKNFVHILKFWIQTKFLLKSFFNPMNHFMNLKLNQILFH